MRRVILLALLFAIHFSVHAQVVAVRQVVSSAGKDTLIGSTIWASTIGEPVIDTYLGSNITLTQGFHQPDGYAITPLIPYINNLVIYPNPGRPNSLLRFYLKADKPTITITIYDAQGKLYQTQTLDSYAGQTLHSLNPQIMAAGTYTVKVVVGFETYMGRYVVIN